MDLEGLLRMAGEAQPLIFILLFTLGATFFVPVALLSITSGVLFGPWYGTFYTLIAATLSAVLSFIIGRYLGRQRLGRIVGSRLSTVTDLVSKGGWRSVAMMRLVPLLPFAALNYAFGLCRINLLHYALATFVFMAPARFAYNYIGAVGLSSLQEGGATVLAVMVVVLLAVVAVVLPPWLAKRRREARLE